MKQTVHIFFLISVQKYNLFLTVFTLCPFFTQHMLSERKKREGSKATQIQPFQQAVKKIEEQNQDLSEDIVTLLLI